MSGKVLGKNIAEQFNHSVQADKSYGQLLRKRSSFHEGSERANGERHVGGVNRVQGIVHDLGIWRFNRELEIEISCL